MIMDKIATLKEILTQNPADVFARYGLAMEYSSQGQIDASIAEFTQLLASHLCSVGQDLERWIYPGQSHAGVIAPSFGDMTHWIADRFAGAASPDPYAPTGLAGITTTTCPS